MTSKNCSSKEHQNEPSISFCQKCEIYMCSKCDQIHTNLCPNHKIINIQKSSFFPENFTIFCSVEKHHQIQLDYFCKTHNQLCCAACIAKIKDKENGQHKDCEVCSINDIKEEKKNFLDKNLLFLENLEKNFEKKYEEIKDIYNTILQAKKEVENYIKKIFSEIKENVNKREQELINEVNNQFNYLYCNEENFKKSENLNNKINTYLNKAKKLNKKFNNNSRNDFINNNNLIYFINECIDIEKNINQINIINENLKKCDLNFNIRIKFKPFIEEAEKAEKSEGTEENSINSLIQKIQTLGEIYQQKINSNFSLKKYPLNITLNEKRKFDISGEYNNIITKTGPEGWMGTIGEHYLEKGKIHRWKIKIIKSQKKHIMVGIAPTDFDINLSDYTNSGYYFYFYNSTLYSSPPYSYYGENSLLNKMDNFDEIIIIANLYRRSLKFIINGEDKGDSYKDLPDDKLLSPSIILFNQYDSVEISPC